MPNTSAAAGDGPAIDPAMSAPQQTVPHLVVPPMNQSIHAPTQPLSLPPLLPPNQLPSNQPPPITNQPMGLQNQSGEAFPSCAPPPAYDQHN